MYAILGFLVFASVAQAGRLKIEKGMPILPAPALQCGNHEEDGKTPEFGDYQVSIQGKTAILQIIQQEDANTAPDIKSTKLKCTKNEKPTPCCDQMGLTYTCTGKFEHHDYHVDVHSGGFFFHQSLHVFRDDKLVADVSVCR